MNKLSRIADEITARGNDMEIRGTREGIKVYEVKRTLVAVIDKEEKDNENTRP